MTWRTVALAGVSSPGLSLTSTRYPVESEWRLYLFGDTAAREAFAVEFRYSLCEQGFFEEETVRIPLFLRYVLETQENGGYDLRRYFP